MVLDDWSDSAMLLARHWHHSGVEPGVGLTPGDHALRDMYLSAGVMVIKGNARPKMFWELPLSAGVMVRRGTPDHFFKKCP